MKPESILELDGISKLIRKRFVIEELDLSIKAGVCLGIYGENGSGKSLLSEVIAGRITPDEGIIRQKAGGCRVSVVSSSEKLRLLDEDRRNDDSEFMQGRVDPGRTVRVLLGGDENYDGDLAELIEEFALGGILDRGLKFLSTGEFRKFLLVKALIEQPDLLVLDDPFTGLDIVMRSDLHALISRIQSDTLSIVIISGRKKDFNGLTDDIKVLQDGRITDEVEEQIDLRVESAAPAVLTTEGGNGSGDELIRMQNVGLSYYDLKVLTDINWKVTSGEHWQIRGRNGSGKSSILSLINGDNPKAYGQELYMFGRRRGSGETVWDIKRRIGTVSGALQQDHRISQNVLSVAVSGYFDSIGLYDKPDPVQIESAEHWCTRFGLKEHLRSPFSALSEGLKRKVLTIRAVIKGPDLLILDEPCQGLDDHNSAVVLETIEQLIEENHSTLLYVSHDPEYNLRSITRVLDLIPHKSGGFTNQR